MMIIKILVLSFIQGLAELLPVSSSAHIILAEKMMDLDPTTPQMTWMLALFHTGTMLAVLWSFRKKWRTQIQDFRIAQKRDFSWLKKLLGALVATAVLGGALLKFIEHQIHADAEHLFGNFRIISSSLIVVGILIVFSEFYSKKIPLKKEIGWKQTLGIGLIQGLCLPFRGFSRSGSTISTAMILGVDRNLAEEFSFTLAILLTPPVLVRELLRVFRSGLSVAEIQGHFLLSLVALVGAFFSGILALKWLSRWLESGRWGYFGYYCMGLGGVLAFFFW